MTTAALMLAVAILVLPCAGRPLRLTHQVARADPLSRESSRNSDGLASASTFDVISVCLLAGMSVPAAAAAAAPSAPTSLRLMLRRAADLLALGGEPETSWAVGDSTDSACIAVMRLARRSASSGAALAHGLAELAEKTRQDIARDASAAAQRAGVLIAGPLGLCFLPAFVCVGVVPVVIGLAGEVFSVGPLS